MDDERREEPTQVAPASGTWPRALEQRGRRRAGRAAPTSPPRSSQSLVMTTQ